MGLDWKQICQWVIIIACGIILYWGLNHLEVDPLQALWFLVLFVLLQQIEGNLIYPRLVGSSVGLSSIWVLVAVSVGGNAMGILGMILFIPGFSVLYKLLARWTNRRLEMKQKKQQNMSQKQ